MTKFLRASTKLFRDEEGASLAEYGLLLALIAVVCMAAMAFIGTTISGFFNWVGGTI